MAHPVGTPNNKIMKPEFKFKLYIGGIGAGKTTLMKVLGGFDTDSARAQVLEFKLKRFRELRDWRLHNDIWFTAIWGAVWAIAPRIVADHGGWFVLHYKAYSYVTEVVWLKVDPQVALDRVLKRDGAKTKLERDLVLESNESCERAAQLWKQAGKQVTILET